MNLRALAVLNLLPLALVCAVLSTAAQGEPPPAQGKPMQGSYSLPDGRLTQSRIDSSPDESFLAVRADAAGRLFVGGREALFVYEPRSRATSPNGGYETRKLLYRFPEHTWIYDIAVRGNDVYVLTVAALYVLPDAVVKREGIEPRRLVWGVPLGHVHQCFHGLTLGPEGDIYLAMGDPLWYYGDFTRPDHWGYWTFFSRPDPANPPAEPLKNGFVATPYHGVGGVFRCRPDGSQFQIVARGLRNSCGLTFDRHWNLFTNDNDHEGMPAFYVPGRLVHVTPHTYFSWPNGWLLSKTPQRKDLLETMNDHLGRFVPVGMTTYDDELLGDEYRDNLLVARWGTRRVTRYPLEHRGASFKAEEAVLLEGHDLARPVSVSVDGAGRVFATVAFMPQNEGSPVYPSELLMIAPKESSATSFKPYDATTATLAVLYAELANGGLTRRQMAHTELLRRGPEALTPAVKRVLNNELSGADADNLIWLAAVHGGSDVTTAFGKLARESTQANVRFQVARVLGEYAPADSADALVELLKDPDPQVQLAALWPMFRGAGDVPQAVIDGPARSDDTYLRQAATLLLAQRSSHAQLESLVGSKGAKTRLAGVLAAGFRLTVPPVHSPLPSHWKLDPMREESTHTVQYAGEKIDIRELGPVGNYTIADQWARGSHTEDQEFLFQLLSARLADADEGVRYETAHFLFLLNDPRSEPRVVAVFAADEERRLGIERVLNAVDVWLVGPFADGKEGFERVHAPEAEVIDLAKSYREGNRDLSWQRVKTVRQFEFSKTFGKYGDGSVYAYFRIESPAKQRAHLLVGSDDGIKVWHNARLVWTNDVSRAALPYQDQITLELEPGSNDILARVRNLSGESQLYLSYRALTPVVVVAPEKIDGGSLADRLAGAQGAEAVAADFLKIDWSKAKLEGNAENGRKLFEGIGCVKCHAARTDATVIGGPSLAEAGRRFTVSHLVESILLPNRQISPVFRATAIVLSDGRQLSGLVVGETAEKLELLQPDAKRVTVAKSDIDIRELQNLSPMPQGVVKRPDELRDLLAYLLSDNP